MWDLSEYKSTFTGYPAKATGASCCFYSQDGTVLVGYKDGFLRCFDIQAKA